MIPLYDDQPSRSFPLVTILTIIANFVVFAWWQRSVGLENSVQMAALVPAEVTAGSREGVWNIFSSMFMHGSWLHLIGNMWFLWIFGNNIEDECGHFRYFFFYVLCGAAAAGAHILANSASVIPLIGASGAVSGVLGAYLLKHPHARVRTAVPVWILNIPAYVFLVLWIGLQIFAQTMSKVNTGDRPAYLAHIGGFIAGMVLINIFQRRREPRLAAEGSWKRTKSDERSWG